MHKDQPYLDGKYAAFGKLIEGEDVLDKIAGVSTNPMDRPRAVSYTHLDVYKRQDIF